MAPPIMSLPPREQLATCLDAGVTLPTLRRYLFTDKRLQFTTQAAIEASLRRRGFERFLRPAVPSVAA